MNKHRVISNEMKSNEIKSYQHRSISSIENKTLIFSNMLWIVNTYIYIYFFGKILLSFSFPFIIHILFYSLTRALRFIQFHFLVSFLRFSFFHLSFSLYLSLLLFFLHTTYYTFYLIVYTDFNMASEVKKTTCILP